MLTYDSIVHIIKYTCCPRSKRLWPNDNVAVLPAPVRVLVNGHLARVSLRSVNDKVIMRRNRGLCTDPLAFTLGLRNTRKTSAKRQSDGCVSHRLKWDPLTPNDVSKVGQHVWEEKE